MALDGPPWGGEARGSRAWAVLRFRRRSGPAEVPRRLASARMDDLLDLTGRGRADHEGARSTSMILRLRIALTAVSGAAPDRLLSGSLGAVILEGERKSEREEKERVLESESNRGR